MTFRNRADAGLQLAAILRSRAAGSPVIVGVVRGGVPVAAAIAHGLRAPLELCVVRNLIPAIEPRTVIGAVAERGAMYLDRTRAGRLGLGDGEVENLVSDQLEEVDRLSTLLRGRPPLELHGRNVILVDDGLVTGVTIRAAIRSLRRVALSVELALPVAASEGLDKLRPFVDGVHCLVSARGLTAVGARYDSFDAVSEAEVASLYAAASARTALPTVASGMLHHVA